LPEKLKTIIKYALTIGLAVLFVWLACKDFTTKEQLNELRRVLLNMNYGWIWATLAVLTVSNGVRAWRWKILLSHIKPDIRIRNLFYSTMIGYAVNLVLPRVGEITRSVNLSRLEKMDAKKIIASVVVERVLDVLIFALLLSLSVFAYRKKINEVFQSVNFIGLNVSLEIAAYLMLGLSMALLVFFIALSLNPKTVERTVGKLLAPLPEKWRNRIISALESFMHGFEAIGDHTKYAEIIFSSVVIWGLYCVATLFQFYAMNLDGRYGLQFTEAIATTSLSAVGNLVTVGGGVSLQYFSAKVVEKIFNVEFVEGSGFGVLSLVINLISTAAVGAGCFVVQGRRLSIERKISVSFQAPVTTLDAEMRK
jgi:uncharacterized protein (TIRG00374 family)